MKTGGGKAWRVKVLIIGVAAILLATAGVSFAWYLRNLKVAESSEMDVMTPYYLTLLGPDAADQLKLAVGSLYPGETRQIVFCVSNRNITEAGDIVMGGSDFDYSMELVHTENLALRYQMYQLEKTDTSAGSDILVEVDGEELYWKKENEVLAGADVSANRWAQAGLTETEGIINRGNYLFYDKDSRGDNFHLESQQPDIDYVPDYYLMEIEWDETGAALFQQYEKETDMIYVLVKALQPEPKKKTA